MTQPVKAAGDGFRNLEAELSVAVELDEPGYCREIIKEGANVNVAAGGSGAMLPLHRAILRQYVEVCRVLLEHGADVHRTCTIGNNALMWAVIPDNVALCRMLVEYGARPGQVVQANVAEQFAFTPFQKAVMCGSAQAVRYFVTECGEDLEQVTKDGKCMLELARNADAKYAGSSMVALLHALKTEQAIAAALPDGIGIAAKKKSGMAL